MQSTMRVTSVANCAGKHALGLEKAALFSRCYWMTEAFYAGFADCGIWDSYFCW